MKKDEIIGGILLLGLAGGGVTLCVETVKDEAESAEERRKLEEFDEICRCSIPEGNGLYTCAPCEEVDCYHEHGWDNKRCETAEGRAELYREREEVREERMRALERDTEQYFEPIHVSNDEPELEEEPVAATPKDTCLDNYLGAKYKKGKCEFPVYERMNGRAGLEKKFESCQINKIIAGKGNTATAHAVCRGVPSIIKVKRYYQKGR